MDFLNDILCSVVGVLQNVLDAVFNFLRFLGFEEAPDVEELLNLDC